MGRLELPIPDMAGGLKSAAVDLEERIKAYLPQEYRDSVAVTAYRKGQTTGLAVAYDDRAENLVYAALEYPAGQGGKEKADPSQ